MKTKSGFNIRNVCGQDLIVAEGEENIDFSNIISMNETSAYLWKAVQKMNSFTVEDMAELLLNEYEVDLKTALNDCANLAAQWGKTGIIEGDDIPKVKVSVNSVEDSNKPDQQDSDNHKDNNKKSKLHSIINKLFHNK